MSNVTIQKRGKYYQYKFETAKIDGKRKFSSKSGFRTKAEAEKEGIKAYNEYMNTGHDFTPSDMSYSDLLDYWLEKHCYINLKYHTIEAYSSIIKNHIILSQIIVAINKTGREVVEKNKLFLIVLSYDGFWFFAMISLIYAIGYEVIRYNSSTYVMFLLFISIMDIVVIPQITKIFKKKLIQ